MVSKSSTRQPAAVTTPAMPRLVITLILAFVLSDVSMTPAGTLCESFTNDLGMTFVFIQPGTFMMGSREAAEKVAEKSFYADKAGSADWFSDEHPLHEVVISRPFYMQASEVTVGQWRAFVQASHYQSEAEKAGWAWLYDIKQGKWIKQPGLFWDNPGFSQDEHFPVTYVSWNDAQAFIRWLSEKDNRSYRLPAEAEWEYACRSGTDTPFYWGDKPDGKYANLADMTYAEKFSRDEYVNRDVNDGYVFTSAVQSLLPNRWGLRDMSGNVWEWCADWYGAYPSGSVTDPAGPLSGEYRVNRGGSWRHNARSCRSARRSRDAPDYRNSSLGFRLVAPAVQ